MAKWLHPITLTGNTVRLEPLSQKHIEDLTKAVSDGNLWELWFTSAPTPHEVENYINTALFEFNNDSSLPFVVVQLSTGKVIGTTRYMNANPTNKRLEIGTTWYAKSSQRTGVNTECKYLLLQYAFEELACIAVEFRTHFHNHQSRRAIERLGAKQDGILRNHQLDKLGSIRDTVVYSILNSEWQAVKNSLEFLMNKTY